MHNNDALIIATPTAWGQIPVQEALPELPECCLVESGLGNVQVLRQPVGQGNPGSVESAALRQQITSLANQRLADLLPDDELVDITDASKHRVQVRDVAGLLIDKFLQVFAITLQFFLFPFACRDVANDSDGTEKDRLAFTEWAAVQP